MCARVLRHSSACCLALVLAEGVGTVLFLGTATIGFIIT